MGQPCDNCASPCCRNYNVVITLVDAYRIATTLRMPITEIAEMRYIDEPDGEYRIKLSGNAEAEPRFHRVVLRKAVDPDPQYTGRCIFLLSVGDRGRCGIYGMRPFVCSTYPTSYDDGFIGLNAGGKYCPPNSWHLEQIDVAMFRSRQSKRSKQKQMHDLLVTAWNNRLADEKRESSVTEFFAYCTTACGELERLVPGSTALDDTIGTDIDVPTAVEEAIERFGWTRTTHLPPIAASSDNTSPTEAAQ